MINNRYFIAIIPPPPYLEQALELKNYFKDHHQSKAFLNSPPHITLHMPFERNSLKEDRLVESLQSFSSGETPVKIDFNNFGCFSPRVIFLQATATPELIAIQHHLRQFCRKELGLFNADYKDHPFHPHITIAFRDLKKPAFDRAWEEFKDKKFEGGFVADRICLLRHDGGEWREMKEFVLGNRLTNVH